jgi:FeS assembly SUF system protein
MTTEPDQTPPPEPQASKAEEASSTAENEALHKQVVATLKTCFDPEIPVDIYELGLIYDLKVAGEGDVLIKMTLTSPMCPVAESLPPEVENKVRALPDVKTAKVEVVWEPPWEPTRMSEAAKLQLNMM